MKIKKEVEKRLVEDLKIKVFLGELPEEDYRKELYGIKKDLEWNPIYIKSGRFAKTEVDEGKYKVDEEAGTIYVPLTDRKQRLLTYHTKKQRIIVLQERPSKKSVRWKTIEIFYNINNANYIEEIYKKL